MNDYRKFIDCNGNSKRIWGNRNDYENGLRFFYNKLNEKLYGGNWKRTNSIFENNIMKIKFEDKFLPRRGRINCSLNDQGKWRWFGTQFTVRN